MYKGIHVLQIYHLLLIELPKNSYNKNNLTRPLYLLCKTMTM